MPWLLQTWRAKAGLRVSWCCVRAASRDHSRRWARLHRTEGPGDHRQPHGIRGAQCQHGHPPGKGSIAQASPPDHSLRAARGVGQGCPSPAGLEGSNGVGQGCPSPAGLQGSHSKFASSSGALGRKMSRKRSHQMWYV